MRVENKSSIVRSYTGIDVFRLAAALLIIAIHTSPLADLSGMGDFVLTRVIARVAVPFFFVTSGFFLISRYGYQTEKLYIFIKKTALIYVAAIALYIPVNLYNGYFEMEDLMPNLIKDIVFDGTLYHLWYLPASIIGGAIAWALVKRLDYKRAFAAAGVLYLIGLCGDSYYGLIGRLPVCSGFYALVFQVSDYTRNGIFFAPVFFVLGGFIADSKDSGVGDDQDDAVPRRDPAAGYVLPTVVCLGLMLAEGLILHHFQLQRHDSMYLFLPPCVYFLFSMIMQFRGKRRVWLRDVSLIVYIIHPMMIVVIRMFAKVLHLQTLLVDNSVVHFLAVTVASVAFSVAAAALWGRFGRKRSRHIPDTDRAYIEIDLENLEHNVAVLREAMPPKCELMAVVKAEAYGHGMCGIAVHLDKIGVRAYAVATVDEGIRLRRCGVRGEILILGFTAPERAGELRRYDLSQTLIDYAYACRLNEQARGQRCRVKVHVKIDTGMHRLGFDQDFDQEEILGVFAMEHLAVNGIYTHLCVADSLAEADVRFTRQQIADFYAVLRRLKKEGVRIPKIHIQSSYGLLNYPELKCSYVRAGIALYGVLSSPDAQTKLQLDLRPVLSLKAKVILLRRVPQGESVGYARTFVADRDSVIAILPVGYADGFPRSLSGGGSYVLINGSWAPIVGRICMDQLAVDVTDIADIEVGMTATLIGCDAGGQIAAPDVADDSGSITNELLSRMGSRLARL
ncbi:MAG: serine racemase VanT catalytic subunit [Lachnospiraceae bacterium]|jgi:serine/alanine racemase|nr:serine racemase VanT catalytic subunit [Lachnospiraceae bacterium]